MTSNEPVFFVTGGGTGGHIYPAVAIADFLDKVGKVFYVGNPRNLEFDIVRQKDYEFLPISVQGLPRKATLDLIGWGVKLCFAVLKSLYYVIKYRPNVVFGTGGYVSAPALIAAKILRVPYIMHDCDANAGLVTRKLAPYASAVSLAFECAKSYIKNKNCHVNGNPLREEFKTLSKEAARINLGLDNKLTIAFMGGSQGAKSVNDAAVEILKTLSKDYDVQVIFQTGKKKFEDVMEKLEIYYNEYKEDKNLLVRPYFDDMVSVMKASDIAVSRAGSLSISELCASGVATIYVPYPFAAADHQRKNAHSVEAQGAGIYLEDSDVTPEKLLELISELVKNHDKLANIQQAALKLAKFDSTIEIVNLIKKSM
ncbi:undecaprenyldiphospho-muramoylpentapeptide beta-N-acetylglucosaminyltransferase [bacterium]|nr:undecaprenyldiphospho-muramoylpentapeptide beta-N-acetylglucosaminyltransferase [bacterium]